VRLENAAMDMERRSQQVQVAAFPYKGKEFSRVTGMHLLDGIGVPG